MVYQLNKVTKKSKHEINIFSYTFPVAYLVGLLIAIIIFISSIIIAMHHQIVGLNRQVFYDLNNLSNIYKVPSLIITEALGAGYPIAICVIVPIIFKRYKLAWRFFVTVGAAGVLMEIAKIIVKEPRPIVLLHGHLHARAVETGLTSFPSGHQSVATAMALTLWIILPKKYKILSIIWIVLVAFSRVYLGVHNPIDIIGGIGIGLFSFYLVRLIPSPLAEKLFLGPEEDLLDANQLTKQNKTKQ